MNWTISIQIIIINFSLFLTSLFTYNYILELYWQHTQGIFLGFVKYLDPQTTTDNHILHLASVPLEGTIACQQGSITCSPSAHVLAVLRHHSPGVRRPQTFKRMQAPPGLKASCPIEVNICNSTGIASKVPTCQVSRATTLGSQSVAPPWVITVF